MSEGEKKDIQKNDFIGKKYVYKIEDEKELQKVEIDKNIILRVIEIGDKKMIDIRRYYKGYPTKRGIRFDYRAFNTLKEILE
jgi:hypothetical protein